MSCRPSDATNEHGYAADTTNLCKFFGQRFVVKKCIAFSFGVMEFVLVGVAWTYWCD